MIEVIIALIVIFTIFPVLGRKVYGISSKKVLTFYFIGVGLLFAFIMIFSTFDNEISIQIIETYPTQIFSGNLVFFSVLLIFYAFGGIGFIGSLAEKTSELIEGVKMFADLKKRTKIKEYFLFLIFGYLFFFSIYSGVEIMTILLGVEFKLEFEIIKSFLLTFQFESIYVVILGISLYNLKAFMYGYFSKEFWRSQTAWKDLESTPFRYIRKFSAIFFFVFSTYMAIIMFFIDFYNLTNPFGEFGQISLLLVFFIFSTFESLYFYKNKHKLVEQLKIQDKDFKKKVDENIMLENDDEDEIKF